jgi:hypothetical protein
MKPLNTKSHQTSRGAGRDIGNQKHNKRHNTDVPIAFLLSSYPEPAHSWLSGWLPAPNAVEEEIKRPMCRDGLPRRWSSLPRCISPDWAQLDWPWTKSCETGLPLPGATGTRRKMSATDMINSQQHPMRQCKQKDMVSNLLKDHTNFENRQHFVKQFIDRSWSSHAAKLK